MSTPKRMQTGSIMVMTPTNIEIGRQILYGVRTYCREHPGLTLDMNYGSPLHEYWLEKALCVVAFGDDEELVKALRLGKPIVETSNRSSHHSHPSVLNDDEAVGRMGAEYLSSLGYRKLAFLSKASFQFARQRASGFVQKARSLGLAPLVFDDFKHSENRQVTEKLLALGNQVGVMVASDMMARWLIEGIDEPGKYVPDRLAILGVDDDLLECHLSPIAISSIRLGTERLGYEAAALGMRLAAGARPPQKPVLIPPIRVIARHSTSKLAVEDPYVLRALRYMREHLGGIFDVSDLVTGLRVNRRVLEKHFQSALDNSIARELSSQRIQRARELLETTDLTVKEIASLIGYSESRMLTLSFKRATGETPSEFRVRIRPGGQQSFRNAD